ncbi:hypothetical protein F2P56_035374 [Juglans regia]|uniref:Uncharacterized protein n=1 Tax=Juglans regia TaxID=51240 RepID=A0A833X643_JUGRE|nr:hypothetical protein F2P56_035374 [Juglans regia]
MSEDLTWYPNTAKSSSMPQSGWTSSSQHILALAVAVMELESGGVRDWRLGSSSLFMAFLISFGVDEWGKRKGLWRGLGKKELGDSAWFFNTPATPISQSQRV